MQPRNPCDVINQILNHVPQEKNVLRNELLKICSDGLFVAPENHQRIWQKLAISLETWLNMPPKHDWEKTIHNIIQNKQ